MFPYIVRVLENAMPFIPVLDVLQAEFIYTAGGQVTETVLQFQTLATMNLTNFNAFGAYLVTWWNTNIKPNVPSTQSLTQIKLTDLDDANGLVVNYATGLPSVGSNAGAAAPNNVALVITKRTSKRGRSYRGRIYHGLLPVTTLTANTVASSTANGLVTAYSILISQTVSTFLYQMVVVSRSHNHVVTSPAETNFVTSLDTDAVVDSQRRRLPKRGR